MKKIIFMLAVISIGATSCKKCYKCTGDNTNRTICEGDADYDYINRMIKAGSKQVSVGTLEPATCKPTI